jgi:hypothetical protein
MSEITRAAPEESVVVANGTGTVRPEQSACPTIRGLLPTPPEMIERLERLLNGFLATPEERKRLLDEMTLQHYFLGYYIAHRSTPDGVEVLAVEDEIKPYLQSLPPNTLEDVTRNWDRRTVIALIE